jgi:transcriptional regulator with XRE-family HTH domain
VVDGLRLSQGWSLKEFAAVLGRNERQVARWINGKEHAQLSVVFAVPALRRPLVIGLARLAGTSMELETVIRIRDVA